MTIDEKLKAFFEGKKVVILGFGREGRSTLKLLGNCNCKSITVADMNPVPESEAEGCTLCCGEDYLTCLDDLTDRLVFTFLRQYDNRNHGN